MRIALRFLFINSSVKKHVFLRRVLKNPAAFSENQYEKQMKSAGFSIVPEGGFFVPSSTPGRAKLNKEVSQNKRDKRWVISKIKQISFGI